MLRRKFDYLEPARIFSFLTRFRSIILKSPPFSCEKVVGEEDIFRTFLERGQQPVAVSSFASSMIEDIMSIPIDNTCIAILDINEENAKEAFIYTEEKIDLHTYNHCYCSQHKQILWDNLVEIIYQNSLEAEGSKNGISYVSLTKDEIREVLQVFFSLEKFVVEKYPSFDVSELACKLENMSFMRADTDKKNGEYYIIASTTLDQVAFYPLHFRSSLPIRKANVGHEGFHVFENVCRDYEENLPDGYGILMGGVSVQTSMHRGFNGLDGKDFYMYDKYYNSRYRFSFLSEVYAEKVTKNMLHLEKMAYFNYEKVLDFLQISLALQPSYSIDGFVEDILYQNPSSFIRRFPILSSDFKRDFLNHLKMLCQSEIILRGISACFQEDLKENNITEEACLATMTMSFLLAVEKIFYSNLILLNETTGLSLEDNLCFMKLFLDKKREACQAMVLENESVRQLHYSLDDSLFVPSKAPRDMMFRYLGDIYGISFSEIEKKVDNYTYCADYVFPAVLPKTSRDYYFSSMLDEMFSSAHHSSKVLLKK